MKNISKKLGIAVLTTAILFSLLFAACNNGSTPAKSDDSKTYTTGATDGRLTITGLEDYEGKYVFAMSDDGELYAAGNGRITVKGDDFTMEFTCVKIEGGQAELKVWGINEQGFTGYNRNDTDVELTVAIYNNASINYMTTIVVGFGYAEVDFASGVGTGAFLED